MKKYITLAALLAAGAVSANAAQLVVSYDSFLSATQKGNESNNTMKTSNGYSPTFENGVAKFDGTGQGDVLFLDGTAIDALSIGKNAGFSITLELSNLSYGNGNGTIFSINQSGGAWGLDVKKDSSNTFIGHWSGNQNSSGYNAEKTKIPVDKFLLTVTQQGRDTTLYINGEHYHTFSGLGTTNTATQVTQINIGNSNAGNSGVTMDLSKLYIHDSYMSADQISTFISTIPEPSAFGMLAGVGALALVASRRRRTQKI